MWLTGSAQRAQLGRTSSRSALALARARAARAGRPAGCWACSSSATTPPAGLGVRLPLRAGGRRPDRRRAGRASVAASAGPIAFVALVVAADRAAARRRLARRRCSPRPCSARVLVVGADLAARTLLPQAELPVGIVTAVLGAPVPALAPRPRKAASRRYDRDPDQAPDGRPLAAEHVRLAYDDRVVVDDLDLDLTERVVHRDRRPQRLRQVDAAARPGPAAAADAPVRCCSTGRRSPGRRPARWPSGSACCRRRRSRPRASPWPTWSPAAGTRTRAGCASGPGDDEAVVAEALALDGHDRPRRPPRRRALRRPAAARLDRHGARPGHRPAAARRADDLPRPRPPDRRAGPGRPAARRARPHRRRGAARPEPGGPVRRSTWSR